MANKFDLFSITQVPRSMNKKAEVLRKLASLTFSHFTKDVWIEVLEQKSTDVMTVPVEEVDTWMSPIIVYLKEGTLRADSVAARKIRIKAPMYTVRDNVLYKKSFMGPLLRCVDPQEAEMVIREVHEGTCGMHLGFRTVVGKIMRLGYYWPSKYRDTSDVAKSCAIDLVGPFPDGRHLVVAVDFFTKWVEAKPLKSITGRQIVNFVWEDIVFRFGVPNEIVNDNGKQFAHDLFRAWYDGLNIKQSFSSVAHTQANGQLGVNIRDIVAGIKSRLGTDSKEIVVPTQCVTEFDEESNVMYLSENLNLLEERMSIAAINEASNKQKIAKYYNQRLRERTFRPGDYVWHNNNASRVEDVGKLGPNWEGPNEVVEALGNGAYNLNARRLIYTAHLACNQSEKVLC
ncbi:uncharacterized protein [Rutidosis leptorrhynchoides]|uniref:uncharacterized protein n=1 Tax=Rutidosis leptorrhynchoides TaxID=125765 RepID=UPI003A99FB3A